MAALAGDCRSARHKFTDSVSIYRRLQKLYKGEQENSWATPQVDIRNEVRPDGATGYDVPFGLHIPGGNPPAA